MSLPPHILRIKRKRTDEPVDSLYLDNASSPAKRRVTTSGHEFVFRRLVDTSHDVSSNSGVASVPDVLATKPGEEEQVLQKLRQRGSTTLNGSAVSRSARRQTSIPPRKFHLSRSASLRASPGRSLVGRPQRKRDVAVFIEDYDEDAAHVSAEQHSNLSTANGASYLAPEGAPRPAQKRPRTPAMTPRTPRAVPEADGKVQTDLYEALQKYATEEFRLSDSWGAGRKEEPILQQEHEHDTMMQDVADTAGTGMFSSAVEEADYVYDTYVRYAKTLEALPNALDNTTTEKDPSTTMEGKTEDENFGYLIIPETDQTLWETFYASDDGDSSENDWDSEEDDENHENWYGADYPEDEVSSDDDRNENPYRYGHDDLEDGDELAWSESSSSM